MLNEAFINLEGTKESLPAVTLFNMVKSYWVSHPARQRAILWQVS